MSDTLTSTPSSKGTTKSLLRPPLNDVSLTNVTALNNSKPTSNLTSVARLGTQKEINPTPSPRLGVQANPSTNLTGGPDVVDRRLSNHSTLSPKPARPPSTAASYRKVDVEVSQLMVMLQLAIFSVSHQFNHPTSST